MTDRTSKIAKLSALIVASVAAVALSAGVVTAEPKGDRDAPTAKDSAKGGQGARQGRAGKGAKHGRAGKGAKHGRGKRAGRIFARFDTNQDGSLQKSEVPERVWKRIGVADANGDQAVTKAELRQAHQDGKLKPHRGRRGGKARRS